MFFLFSRSDPDFHQGHINSIIIKSIVLYIFYDKMAMHSNNFSLKMLFQLQRCNVQY